MPRLVDVIPQVFENLQARMTSEMPVGLPTGITQLDDVLGGGWERQELSYLVGDSSVGKSWLASFWILAGAKWLAEHPDERPMSSQEKENKLPVIVFWSLEMAELQVVVRLLTQTAKQVTEKDFDSAKLKRGDLGGPDESITRDLDNNLWRRRAAELCKAYLTLYKKWAHHVIAEFDINRLGDFIELLDEITKNFDIVMVVIDYFRLMQESESEGTVVAAQEERSRQLITMAKSFDCHVLSIIDINRLGQTTRGGVKLQHIRGGVAAQYDADVIMILEKMISPSEELEEDSIHAHLMLKIAKQRFGRQGSIELYMNQATGHVEEWDLRERMEYNGTLS